MTENEQKAQELLFKSIEEAFKIQYEHLKSASIASLGTVNINYIKIVNDAVLMGIKKGMENLKEDDSKGSIQA